MSRKRIPAGQLRSGRAVLLLTIDWAGQVYRFASEPVDLADASGATLRYGGGLSVQDIAENLERDTIAPDDLAVPIELWFPVDVVARKRDGYPLSMATAELSMVMVKGGIGAATPQQDWEDRFVLMDGFVSEPNIGVPTESPRRAAFSLQSLPYEDGTPLLNARRKISNSAITSSDNKPVPLVFGNPGVYVDAGGITRNVSGSPAYETTGNDGSVGNLRRAGLTVGETLASQVILINSTGATATRTVESVVGVDGFRTEAEELLGATIWDSPPVWTIWLFGSGGIANPYGDGSLTGLGDIIRYVLSQGSVSVDHEAWIAAAPYLNRYRLAGYINDPEATVWGWLVEHVLPIIPSLRVIRGSNGLLPVLYGTDRPVDALHPVATGPGFRLASGEQDERPATSIINDITLEYAYNAETEKPKRAFRVGPKGVEGVDLVSPQATVSHRIYGHRIGQTISSWYIYDDDSARRILTDYIARHAFIGSEVTIQASPEWGWLDLGDEISLTSTELQLTAHRAVVVGRAWQVLTGQWVFTLWISPDPLVDVGA